MPRSWFRHDSQMRYDPAVSELCDEFGPVGDLLWRRLLELHCDDDGGIKIRRQDLASALHIRPEWNVDIESWLKRAAYLKLIRVRKPSGSRTDLLHICARHWIDYNPAYETREAARERKRKSRQSATNRHQSETDLHQSRTDRAPENHQSHTGTDGSGSTTAGHEASPSQGRHSDNPVTSHATGRYVLDVTNEQDVDVTARGRANGEPGVSHETPKAESNGVAAMRAAAGGEFAAGGSTERSRAKAQAMLGTIGRTA